MSKLNQLIKELCPDGVEYFKIGDIAKVGTGSSNGSEAEDDGIYPFFVRSQTIKYKNDFEYDEEAIIIPGEGGIGEIFHYMNGKYAIHQRVYRIHFENKLIDTCFVYHYMKSRFKKFILQRAVSATVISIRKPMIEQFQIPIPPLEIQREIVRILDNFTELTAELTARKKQYEYYREQLFNLNEATVNYECLGDENIGKFTRGSGLQKKDFTDTGIGCIHYGQIYTYYGTYTDKTKTFVAEEFAKKTRKAKCGDLIIATTSENDEDVCKAVAWLGCEEIAVSSDACFYSHNMHPKYVTYFFQTEQFQRQKRPLITGTKVRRVNVDNLSKIKIPIPPLAQQQRIVDILDRFDTLCNDISQGIPAEIKARQKQYEYYRDKLLNFKKINTEV